MNRRLRVLLLIPHLGGGGAERVTELLARHLSRDKYEVHLGLVTKSAHSDAAALRAALPEGVCVHCLEVRRVRWGALRLLRLIWRIRPEVILSGMAHLNFLVLLMRSFLPCGTRVLVRQNGTATSMVRSGLLGMRLRMLFRVLYPRADRVICQSRAMAEDLERVSCIAHEKLVVLMNPVNDALIKKAGDDASRSWTGTGPHLLAVGRLSGEKGFDILLRAFAKVKSHFPAADISIAGAGPLEGALRAQSDALGFGEAVRFLGEVEAPWEYFGGATMLVVPSRSEGIPNALLEAAVAGLPLVVTPASGGMVELLRGRPGAWMASGISSEALTESMIAALGTLVPQQRFQHEWIEPFRLENAIPAYEKLLDDVAAKERA